MNVKRRTAITSKNSGRLSNRNRLVIQESFCYFTIGIASTEHEERRINEASSSSLTVSLDASRIRSVAQSPVPRIKYVLSINNIRRIVNYLYVS